MLIIELFNSKKKKKYQINTYMFQNQNFKIQ